MSSNQYGFTCCVTWQCRQYDVQVVYEGTFEDDPDSLERVTASWESTRPEDVATAEILLRDWKSAQQKPVRARVWSAYGGWLKTDNLSDPTWNPPTPDERDVFAIIAHGLATDIEEGWDT